MIDVLIWVLSTLTITPQKGFAGIKPYNPILGEQFHCHWEHDDGSITELHAEQVSHHPPITGLNFRNQKNNFRYMSSGEFKAKFRGNYVDSAVEGNHILLLQNFDEAYEVTWPTLVARGILWGNARIEHGSNLIMYCQKTGYKAQINFDKSDHKLSGHIYLRKEKIYKIEGELTDKIYIRDDRKKSSKTVLLDVAAQTREKYVVPDITKQGEMDSRRVWHTVTFPMKTGDFDKAAKNKIDIEEYQRKLAKQRKEKGEVWVPKLFVDTNQRTSTNVPVYAYKDDSDLQVFVTNNEAAASFNDSSSADETSDRDNSNKDSSQEQEIEEGVGDLDLD